VFREFRKAKVVSVVPTAGAGKLQFQVVRAGGPLGSARAVDAPQPFLLGSAENAVARLVGSKDPDPVWPLDDADSITVPRVATTNAGLHAAALRHGGKAGKVAMGWLEASGRRRTALADVQGAGQFSGTPAIAPNESSVAITFATRKTADSPWSVAITSANLGKLPAPARAFALPPGGPGGEAISPSIAPLSGNRWLLQWTEGRAGGRVVRAQALSNDLEPLSDAVNLSPKGTNAGQGAAWTQGTTAAVLFYVQNEKKSHELWGASIDCPP